MKSSYSNEVSIFYLHIRKLLRQSNINCLGTFDVSIVKCEGTNKIEVLSTAGHKHLGGQDIDKIIMEYVLNNFKDFPKNNTKMMKRLLEACTEAKITLSSYETTIICIDRVDSDESWELELNRDKFNELCGKVFLGTLDIVNEALKQANLKENNIDRVILAGGSTRIAMVKNLLKEKFGERKIWNRHNPDEVVAKGAALVANSFLNASSNDNIQLLFNDIVPLSIGQRIHGKLMYFAIKRGTRYPCKAEQITVLGQDNQKSVNINIYEGERKQCKYNFKIGNIKLDLKNRNSRRGYETKVLYFIQKNLKVKTKA
ncbi:hypothetical protein WR25_11631 isoform B, partial [Diploscapter pachys]